MFVLIIINFIILVVVSLVFFYKITLLNDELDEIYEQIYYYIDKDFCIGGKHDD
jgi:hypothetical protein